MDAQCIAHRLRRHSLLADVAARKQRRYVDQRMAVLSLRIRREWSPAHQVQLPEEAAGPDETHRPAREGGHGTWLIGWLPISQ